MGISIWQLLIILAIVLVIFGAKRLKNLGSDLGGAIKGFKKAVNDEDEKAAQQKAAEEAQQQAALQNPSTTQPQPTVNPTTSTGSTGNVYDAQVTATSTQDKPKV
jgi:sec-independent protein translocase protein TatA